jgi:hypothetical protein
MKLRSAVDSDLFVAESRAPNNDSVGYPLVKISEFVVVAALGNEVD